MLKVVYVQFVALVCLPTVDERDLEEEIMVGSAVFDLAGPTCKCFCPLVCVVHCIHPFLFFSYFVDCRIRIDSSLLYYFVQSSIKISFFYELLLLYESLFTDLLF